MLQLKQNISLELFHNSPAIDTSQDYRQKCLEFFQYLLTPEDTTNNEIKGRIDTGEQEKKSTRSTFKAVFWFAASLAASLLLGQLQ